MATWWRWMWNPLISRTVKLNLGWFDTFPRGVSNPEILPSWGKKSPTLSVNLDHHSRKGQGRDWNLDWTGGNHPIYYGWSRYIDHLAGGMPILD